MSRRLLDRDHCFRISSTTVFLHDYERLWTRSEYTTLRIVRIGNAPYTRIYDTVIPSSSGHFNIVGRKKNRSTKKTHRLSELVESFVVVRNYKII